MRKFSLEIKRLFISLIIGLVFVFSFSQFFTKPAEAGIGINRQINFQGKLVNNPSATNVANTSYTVVFTLYDNASGGTALWTETQSVTTTDGIFRVALGSVTAFPANFNFNWSGLYLGIKVNADSEMTPRVQMAAVPFAFNAEKVAGLTVQDTSGNASTSGTLQVGNGKTISFSDNISFGTGTTGTISLGSSSNTLTLTTSGNTTLALPTSGTLCTTASCLVSDPYWNQLSGTLFPNNSTTDFLIGGQATTSAQFGVLNIAKNQAVATVSGNLIVMPNNGWGGQLGIGTTNPVSLLNVEGRSANWSETTPGLSTGTIHLDPGNTTNNFGNAITFGASDSGNGETAQAGIYVRTDDTYGSKMYFATTDAYATGAQVHLSIDQTGNVLTTSVNDLYVGVNRQSGKFAALQAGTSGSSFAFDATGNFYVHAATALNDYSIDTTHNLTFTGAGSYGFLGINETSPNAILDVNGTGDVQFNNTGNFVINTTTPTITTGTNQNLIISPNGSGKVGFFTTSPLSTLDIRANSVSGGTIAVASVSGQTSFAALVANNDGVGDILTASKSGLPIFTVKNNGQFTLGAPYYTAGCSALETNSSGTLVCGTDDTGSGGGYSPFQELAGAIVPNNSTMDFLIGGQATTSAEFSITGLSNLSNQVNASLSGQLIVMANNGWGGNATISGALTLGAFSNGVIQTTSNQLLTLGGNTTGDIQFKPGNSSTGLYLQSTGNVGIGTTVPSVKLNVATSGNAVGILNEATDTGYTAIRSKNTAYAGYDYGIAGGAAAVPNAFYIFDVAQSATRLSINPTTGNISIGGMFTANAPLSFGTGVQTNKLYLYDNTSDKYGFGVATNTLQIYTGAAAGANATIQFGKYDGTTLTEFARILDGRFGIGTTSPTAPLHVNSGYGSNAAFIVNNLNNGDLIAASASGVTKFRLDNSGNASMSGSLTMVGANSIQTTSNTLLTIGGATTGNITLSPNNGTAGLVSISGSSLFTTGTGLTTLGGSLTISGTAITLASATTIDSSGAINLGTTNATTLTLGRSTQGITLPGFLTCTLKTDGSGVLQCGTDLQGSGGGYSPFQELSGAILPNNSTMDFLIGGQATTSALFAITGIAAGAPVATLSASTNGNGLVLSASDSTIQSLRNNGLILGGNTTGGIQFKPGNSSSSLYLSSTGNVGAGTTNPGEKLTVGDGTANVDLSVGSSTANKMYLSTSGNSAFFAINRKTSNGVFANSSLGASNLGFFSTATGGYIDFNTINAVNTNPVFRMRVAENGNVGIGITSPTAPLHVNSGYGSNAALIVNQLNSGDILAASASGATKFTIANNGDVVFTGALTGVTTLAASGAIAANGGITFDGPGDTLGAFTMAGNIIGGSFIITDIGSTGTDFDTSGGLSITTDAAGTALTVDNAANASSIFVAEDNNTPVFTIVDGGDITWAAASPTITINAAETFTISNGTAADNFIYNTSTNVLQLGDGTNGLTFDIDTGMTYQGSGRKTKTIHLAPEYPGAILTASGSGTTNGSMTSDASPSATFQNYYEWSSTQASLQDYTVAVHVKLPADFSAWPTSNAITVEFNTATINAPQNKFDFILFNTSDASPKTPVVMRTANVSSVAKTWQTLTITGADLTSGTATLNTAGHEAVIYLKMYAGSPGYVQVGDIELNYLSAF